MTKDDLVSKDTALKMAIEFIEMHLTTNDRTFIERTATLQACKEALEHQEVGDAEIKQMLNDIEYYQKRVEELEQPLTRDWKETIDERIAKDDEFKRALEQPAQEPVEYLGALATMDGSVNLYYKKSSWQELSGDDMHKIIVKYVSVDCTCDPYEFARAIEQALKEKNNG